MVPETKAMKQAKARVATYARYGNTAAENQWRRTYARLEAAELRRRADELEKKYPTD
jgi:hypothetical protein